MVEVFKPFEEYPKLGEEIICKDTGMKMVRVMNDFTFKVQADFPDGSKRADGSFISQRHLNSIRKRKVTKSAETIAQERGEI